jgi:hypothetical protein
MAQAQSDPETRLVFLQHFSEPLRNESSNLIRGGLEQGQFRSDLDISRLLDAAVGAIYLRLLFGQSLDPAWAHDLTDMLLKGCLPATRPSRNSRNSK